jgi:phage terminase small subunit
MLHQEKSGNPVSIGAKSHYLGNPHRKQLTKLAQELGLAPPKPKKLLLQPGNDEVTGSHGVTRSQSYDF